MTTPQANTGRHTWRVRSRRGTVAVGWQSKRQYSRSTADGKKGRRPQAHAPSVDLAAAAPAVGTIDLAVFASTVRSDHAPLRTAVLMDPAARSLPKQPGLSGLSADAEPAANTSVVALIAPTARIFFIVSPFWVVALVVAADAAGITYPRTSAVIPRTPKFTRTGETRNGLQRLVAGMCASRQRRCQPQTARYPHRRNHGDIISDGVRLLPECGATNDVAKCALRSPSRVAVWGRGCRRVVSRR